MHALGFSCPHGGHFYHHHHHHHPAPFPSTSLLAFTAASRPTKCYSTLPPLIERVHDSSIPVLANFDSSSVRRMSPVIPLLQQRWGGGRARKKKREASLEEDVDWRSRISLQLCHWPAQDTPTPTPPVVWAFDARTVLSVVTNFSPQSHALNLQLLYLSLIHI